MESEESDQDRQKLEGTLSTKRRVNTLDKIHIKVTIPHVANRE